MADALRVHREPAVVYEARAGKPKINIYWQEDVYNGVGLPMDKIVQRVCLDIEDAKKLVYQLNECIHVNGHGD